MILTVPGHGIALAGMELHAANGTAAHGQYLLQSHSIPTAAGFSDVRTGAMGRVQNGTAHPMSYQAH